MTHVLRFVLHVSMALNQLVNVITGGDPDMSVSARAAFARERGSRGGAFVCRVLDAIDPHSDHDGKGDHCAIALENNLDDRNRYP